MPELTAQEIQNVVPGESMMKERGVLPFDKPAKTSSPDAGIQLVFDAVTEPRSAKRLIKVLENGTTIDTVVDSMLMMMHGEGVVSPQALPIMAPAIAALIEGMAKIAGAPINYKEKIDEWSKPDEENVEKIMAKLTTDLMTRSVKEDEMINPQPSAAEDNGEGGLMTRPTEGDM